VESSVIADLATPTLENSNSIKPNLVEPSLVDAYSDTYSVETYTTSQPEARSQSSSKTVGIRQEIQIFLSTFITIFLAELGDKTQLTTLLMSAESNSPWIVFLGAGSALVATSLLGVCLGHWLSKRVSARTLETSAAVLLMLISVWLLWDVMQG